MEFLESLGQAILDALVNLWDQIIGYLPNLIAALVILIIGILIAKAIAKLVQKIIEAIKVDGLIRKINIVQKIEESGTRVILSHILAWLVKWFLYIVLLVAIAEILNLGKLADFINDIALYLPNVIIAVLILVVGLVLGDFVDTLIVKLLKSTKAKLAPLVGAIAKWSIFIFSILAALIQLGVAVALIQTLFTAIVVTLALSAGLAFGLGGRDAAKEMIAKMQRDINE
jgi:mechanosensitive ion channel-like protein